VEAQVGERRRHTSRDKRTAEKANVSGFSFWIALTLSVDPTDSL